jgi:hypothetical protein
MAKKEKTPPTTFMKEYRTEILILGLICASAWISSFVSIAGVRVEAACIRPNTLGGFLGIFSASFIQPKILNALFDTVGIGILGGLMIIGRGYTQFFALSLWLICIGGLATFSIISLSNPHETTTEIQEYANAHCGAGGLVFGWFAFLLVVPFMERPLRLKSLGLTIGAGVLYGICILSVFGAGDSSQLIQEFSGLGAGILFAGAYFKLWLKGYRERCMDEEGRWRYGPAGRRAAAAEEGGLDDDTAAVEDDGGDASWFSSFGGSSKKAKAPVEEADPFADPDSELNSASSGDGEGGTGGGFFGFGGKKKGKSSSKAKAASGASGAGGAGGGDDDEDWFVDDVDSAATSSTAASSTSSSSGLRTAHRSAATDDANPFVMADHSAYSVDAMFDSTLTPEKAQPPPPPAVDEEDDDVQAWLDVVQSGDK